VKAGSAPLLLGIDQGTTRTKACIVDRDGRVVALAAREVPARYPRPGWVEQDPLDLLRTVLETAREALVLADAPVVAMGLANQGETVVAWDVRTGLPIAPAIGWQDRRTEALCHELEEQGMASLVRARTGLPIDPYFSATKIRWILDQVPAARVLAARGDLRVGTSDAWLLWSLTGRYRTDDSTASRTMLYNPRTRDWDQQILDALQIPRAILPEIRPSRSHFGTVPAGLLGYDVPLTASLVDQQAALFGQACHRLGSAKVTYGTGAFLLVNTGREMPVSAHGLLPTVAWSTERDLTFALDGGIYVAGAAVQWLRDGLGIIEDVAETAALAMSVPDSGGVVVVPALAGLAAPYWDSAARGTILGLSRGTTRAHIVRATLEGIAFRTRDVLDAMVRDTGLSISQIKVDGGASANPFLMRCLAELLEREVVTAASTEATAIGAAQQAGVQAGVWPDEAAVAALWRAGTLYVPSGDTRLRRAYDDWLRAVDLARRWGSGER